MSRPEYVGADSRAGLHPGSAARVRRDRIARAGPLPRAAPALATITQPIAAHSRGARASPSSARPTSAATAGSRLIQMPKIRAGMRRSVSISSRYGMTDDSSPAAIPVPITASRSGSPRPADPAAAAGVTAAAATTIAMVSPEDPGNRRPVDALSRM